MGFLEPNRASSAASKQWCGEGGVFGRSHCLTLRVKQWHTRRRANARRRGERVWCVGRPPVSHRLSAARLVVAIECTILRWGAPLPPASEEGYVGSQTPCSEAQEGAGLRPLIKRVKEDQKRLLYGLAEQAGPDGVRG